MGIYKLLDYFFLIFHLILVVFNLFGWLVKRTRKLNFLTLTLTFLAWFGLGLFYGIGYCPLTDWHWQILKKIGETGLPDSYITYIIERATGIKIDDYVITVLTVVLFFAAYIISIVINFRDIKRKRRAVQNNNT